MTGYNSTYSDRPFLEKRTIPGGFNDSSVHLNKFVKEQTTWTQEEIIKRGEMLAEWAIEITMRFGIPESSCSCPFTATVILENQ